MCRFLSGSEEMNGVNGGALAAPKIAPVAPPGASAAVTDNEANVSGCVEAIYVRNANKSYGVGKRRSIVLDNLDMTVKKGSMQVQLLYIFIYQFN